MQTKTKKKGFTLVELVIVVAVIAVLSAILIPTIGCFVEDAKETSDMTTVKTLNTALVRYEAENDKPETMYDTIKIMAGLGYNVDRLTPLSTGHILWDSKNNRFLLKDKNGDDVYRDNTTVAADNIDLWKVVTPKTGFSDKYSNYLVKGDYSALKNNVGELEFVTGVDVGENKDIKIVKYARESSVAGQTVTIRTNGGDLTVDAENDTVHHYDYVKVLKVIAVSSADCYYEHGFIETLTEFSKGKFVTTKTTRFYQSEEAIMAILNGEGVTKDFTIAPKYGQNIYDENGKSIIDDTVSPDHVHTEVIDEAVPATCQTPGKTEGKHCSVCGQITVEQQETGLADHTPGAGDKCTVCGTVVENANLEPAITVKTYKELKERLESKGTVTGSELSKITVRLGANIVAPEDGIIEQSNTLEVTFDLHGYTLTLYNSAYDEATKNYGLYGFFVRGAMTIKDSSLAGCGQIVAAETENTANGGLITVEKSSKNAIFGKSNNQFILQSGTIDSSNNANGCAIMMWHSGCVQINGGVVKASSYAISGSKYDVESTLFRNRLIVNGGRIESVNSYAIYHPQYNEVVPSNIASKKYATEEERIEAVSKFGIFQINGGEIKGKTGAVYMCGNTNSQYGKYSGVQLEITDGTLSSDGDCVIYINSTYLNTAYTGAKTAITISGGIFNTTKDGAYFIKAIADQAVEMPTGSYINGSKGISTIYLKGGIFNMAQNKYFYAKNYTSATKTEESKISPKAKSGFAIVPNETEGTWSVVPV